MRQLTLIFLLFAACTPENTQVDAPDVRAEDVGPPPHFQLATQIPPDWQVVPLPNSLTATQVPEVAIVVGGQGAPMLPLMLWASGPWPDLLALHVWLEDEATHTQVPDTASKPHVAIQLRTGGWYGDWVLFVLDNACAVDGKHLIAHVDLLGIGPQLSLTGRFFAPPTLNCP